MEALAIYEKDSLTAQDIQAQVQLIQQVMGTVMKNEVHYGTVPGCGDKPALFKPGAEKILATFRLSANPEIEDLSTTDEIRYRIKMEIQSANGVVIGYGVGECSSNEDKFKWRRSVCDAEFQETPADRRRKKWKKGYGSKKDYTIDQVRTDVADIANTVLKMAKKRSLVDACLTTTACSDIFEQDIEDMAGLMDFGKPDAKPAVKKTQSKSSKKTAAPKGEEQEHFISVKDVTFVEGESKKSGKPYTKTTIESAEGSTYSTFDTKIKKEAEEIVGTDVQVRVKFESGQYGNTIKEWDVTGEVPPDDLPTDFPPEE